jgi:hypothetical protein
MPLTDFEIKKLAAKEKPYPIADGRGLAVLVHPNGSKYWQLLYRFDVKAKLLALGVYPETTLAEARQRHNEARKQIANDIGRNCSHRPSTRSRSSKRANLNLRKQQRAGAGVFSMRS